MLQTILQSPEFGDPANFRAKVKTPLEFVVAWCATSTPAPTAADLITPMGAMGLRLFENPVPTGWSETGDDWINSNLLLQRINFVNQVVRATGGTHHDSATHVLLGERRNHGGRHRRLPLRAAVPSRVTALEHDVALDILTDGGSRPFDINAPDADTRLRRMLGTVLSMPEYQYQ